MHYAPFIPALTLADVLSRLGVPAHRVLLNPLPGQATEKDLLRCKRKLVELIDGTLVEKPTGWYESRLAAVLIAFIEVFARKHRLGFTLGEQGLMRVERGQLRLPDVAFYSWDHFPKRKLPRGQILDILPDLAVEILSPSNTKRELKRKRREYFAGGTKLVWQVDPRKRCVAVYTAPNRCTVLEEVHTLDGSDVLPGFKLSIREWFAEAGERE